MNYTTLRLEGGLFTADTIEQVMRGNYGGQRPEDFGLKRGVRIVEEVAAAWNAAQNYWNAFQSRTKRLTSSQSTVSVTRDMWLIPLLELLGFELQFERRHLEVDGQTFPVSHTDRSGGIHLPIDLEGLGVSLDRRRAGRPGRQAISPQGIMQEYLNRSEHLWGITANGTHLRLLRQSARTAGASFVEFDLATMMEGAKFDEFAVLYRLCHRSRFPRSFDDAADCFLEKYHQTSIDQGSRIRDRLRDGVQKALEMLGSELLKHPDNGTLRNNVRLGLIGAEDLYQQMLRFIYRLLFLMVAEERDMLAADSTSEMYQVYREHYSLGDLRRRAKRVPGSEPYGDLWLRLQETFSLFEDDKRGKALGLGPLNGMLFSPDAMPELRDASLPNHVVLTAIRHLSYFEDEKKILRWVNYADLDVEELGSVYESLIEFRPDIEGGAGGLTFRLAAGTEKKSTGTYYTPGSLVEQLIQSALEPALRDRWADKETVEEKGEALLGMKVCDPATGSGHFLLAAARYLGRELAKLETGEQEPPLPEYRKAVNRVIRNCIYGVDINPLAVELCKVSLWIEGNLPGEPLSFLDHRILCGDSVVGVFDMKVLEKGIPNNAFNAVTGDEKAVASSIKKRNREEIKHARTGGGQKTLAEAKAGIDKMAALTADWLKLARAPEATVDDIHRKAQEYEDMKAPDTPWAHLKAAADLWTAAFFAPLTKEDLSQVPTSRDVFEHLSGGKVDQDKLQAAKHLAAKHQFFHWPLEFPDVFGSGEDGGFDVMLGNPPWEKIKLQEKEFFASRHRDIARAPNAAARKRLIDHLQLEDAHLYAEFVSAKRRAEGISKFVRQSNRFPLTAVGDINYYGLFAELAIEHLRPGGRMGQVVPTGIATDFSYRHYFRNLTENKILGSLYDFENRRRIFREVDSRLKFCLLSAGKAHIDTVRFGFFLTRTEQIADSRRVFSMSPDDLLLVNPNTGTCPVFRTTHDAALTSKIYRRVPVLIDRVKEENAWGIRFLRMFDMSNDSRHFHQEPGESRLPLYEGKLLHQFDHRWASYSDDRTYDLTDKEKEDPGKTVNPRYWIPEKKVQDRVPSEWSRKWFIAFRDITNATNERTVIVSLIPWSGAGNKAPLIIHPNWKFACALLANFNSLSFDYVARQKMAGTTLNFYVLEQFSILPPSVYTPDLLGFINPRVLELTYTAYDLEPFARDMGYKGDPFPWDPGRRAQLRAELDGLYAHLYGLTRDELRYILDPKEVHGEDYPGETFRVLKENEIKEFGEYRTARLVLEAYDDLAGFMRRSIGTA